MRIKMLVGFGNMEAMEDRSVCWCREGVHPVRSELEKE